MVRRERRRLKARLDGIARRLTDLTTPQPLIGYGGHNFDQDPSLCEAAPGLSLGPDAVSVVAA